MPDVAHILTAISPLLQRTDDDRPIVVMMCGMAGE
jgi:hypothetical protein